MGMEFVFVNVNEPKDALQLAKEPEIRAHITRRQWKQIEIRETAAYQKKRKFVTIGFDSGGGSRMSQSHTLSGATSNHIQRLPTSQSKSQSKSQPQPQPQPQSRPQQTLPVLPIFTFSIPPQLGGLRIDPFRSYPVPFKPFLPLLVDHC